MEKLIGIVIPDDIKARLVDFCTKYDPTFTEPYMALVMPEKLNSVRGIDRGIQSFCLSQPPFTTIVGGPNVENAKNGKSLYLTVMMGPLNTTRGKLVQHLKIQTDAKDSFFRAQLVLVSSRPEHTFDFDAMLKDAKETFSKAQEFSVNALAIYSRENEQESFKIDSRYPFTGR